MRFIKNISMKVWFLIFIGIGGIIAIISFSYYAKRYYDNSYKIMYNLILLKNYENQLDYEVLYNSLFLYVDNDKIAKNIHKIRALIEKLEKNSFFKSHYENSYKSFLKYKQEFLKEEKNVFEFLRFNLPIKNSLMYLLNSANLVDTNVNNYKKMLKVINDIFLFKNSMDISFLNKIKQEKLISFQNSKNQYLKAFYNNFNVYIKYIPYYKKYLNLILTNKTIEYLNQSISYFKNVLNQDLKLFEFLSFILVGYITFIISLLIAAIIKLDDKIKTVTFLLKYDNLTGLKNRYSFLEDIKNYKKAIVVLFNIDKFKNINDFFGNKIGDKVLRDFGRYLEFFLTQKNLSKSNIYRIGADDFAIVLDGDNFSIEEAKNIANDFIYFIENKNFKFKNSYLNINVSAGITDSLPYLETADIALKNIKKDIKEKIAIYDINMHKDIEDNIIKSKEIKEAIENNKITAYFQPIFDKDKEICKYEVLCRVILQNNEVKSIYPYLNILKENKLYHKITLKILETSFNVLKNNKDIKLSINISLEDIKNIEIKKYILENIQNENIGKRMTFEILESEIENYDLFEKFIKDIKIYGVSFAIDDFGSGYSNFNRVLNLDIDYLKIDGSIIRDILHNEKSKILLETIIDFAKKSKKITIAEFVENKEIFEFLKQLGIECFQGYYLGKPKSFLEK